MVPPIELAKVPIFGPGKMVVVPRGVHVQ